MIEVKSLSAGFHGVDVIHDITFSIDSPSVTGIIGPNGSGKSTLLKALAGVHDFTGEALYDGHPLASLPRRKRVKRLSYVAQHSGPAVPLKVREVVELGRTAGRGPFATPTTEDEAIVVKALTHTDLTDLSERRLSELSGGQVQRAMVARAMAQRATHMLLDEPTNHLDPRHQYKLMEILRHLGDEHRTAIVLALHNLELAARYCDRLIVLQTGSVIADGTPDDILTPRLLEQVFGVRGELTTTHHDESVLAIRGPIDSDYLR